MSSLVQASSHGAIGTLRLHRPEKRNALNHALVDQASQGIDRFVSDGVAVAVLEAEGPIFSAGADVDEALGSPDVPASERFIAKLMSSPLFFVASVAAPALGAGVAVVAVCPLAICSEDAWFSLPEIRLGLFPSGVMAYLEPSIGSRRCLELGLAERRLAAPEAAQIGLVNEAVPGARLAERVAEWTEHLAEHPAVTDRARMAWQLRFAAPSFVARKAELDRLLEGSDAE